jgi:hypothetical protein
MYEYLLLYVCVCVCVCVCVFVCVQVQLTVAWGNNVCRQNRANVPPTVYMYIPIRTTQLRRALDQYEAQKFTERPPTSAL